MNRSLLIIISGPSGVGKTSIAQLLLEELMPLFHIEKIITYTTREQRNNEQDGIDYHFITHETFIEKKNKISFLKQPNTMAIFMVHQIFFIKKFLQIFLVS